MIADGVAAVERGPRLRAAPHPAPRRAPRQACSASTSRSSTRVSERGRATAWAAPIPELVERRALIEEVVRAEEERFAETLDKGLALLAEEIATRCGARGATALPGDVAFKLYDTYGFPLDLTEDILRERRHRASTTPASTRAMDAQRARGRAARKASPTRGGADRRRARVVALRRRPRRRARVDGRSRCSVDGERARARRATATTVDVVTAETPFYGESGGQVGDRGVIETAGGALVEVIDTHEAAARPDRARRHASCAARVAAGDRVRLAIDARAPRGGAPQPLGDPPPARRRCAASSASTCARPARWSRPTGCASTSATPAPVDDDDARGASRTRSTRTSARTPR